MAWSRCVERSAGLLRSASSCDVAGGGRRSQSLLREARDQEELDILTNFMSNHFKWSLALGDDPCLLLIPGTHCRNATEEERTGLLEDKKADIPGQQEIFLKKGETLWWSG